MEVLDFFRIPPDKINPRRMYFLDGLRGIALLLMVMTHGVKNWINPALETPETLFIKEILTRIPAPLFLFMVGAAYVLSKNARLRKGWERGAILKYYLKRSVILLFLAYLYRFIDLPLFGVSWKYIHLAVVDILNVIAVSLFFVTVADHATCRRPWSASFFLLTAFMFLALAPLLQTVTFPRAVPVHVTAYVYGQPPHAYFSIFPYSGYVFFGAYVTHQISRFWPETPFKSYRRLVPGLLLLILIVRLVESLTASGLFQEFCAFLSYHSTGFAFILLGAWLAFHFQRRVGFGFVLLVGSHTMIAYWIHAKVIYIGYRHFFRLSTWGESFFLLLKTYLVTIMLTLVYVQVKKRIIAYRKGKLAELNPLPSVEP